MRKASSFLLLVISIIIVFTSPIFIASKQYSYIGFGILGLGIFLFFASIVGWNTGKTQIIAPPRE